MLAHGHSNAELAAELFVSEGTIKTHVSSLLAKLGSVTACRPSSWRMRVGWSRPARRRVSVLRQRRSGKDLR